ncbi:MAG: hypothetical protein ACRDFW_07470 [bacterium]
MKNHRLLNALWKCVCSVLVATILFLFSPGLLAESPHSEFSRAPFRLMGATPPDPIPNTVGTMRRFDSGLSWTVFTKVPVDATTQEAAFTVWVVIFNKPENCTNPISDSGGVVAACSMPDFNAAEAAVLWGTGILVEQSFVESGVPMGVLNVSGQLGVGPDGVLLPGSSLRPGILADSKKPEIHLVVRNHGALDGLDDFLEFSTGQIGGDPALLDQARNIQFAVFRP